MVKQATFALITLFWVVMNFLLWRSELGPGHDLASAVPASLVWEKILTAPDDSHLSLSQREKKLGYLRLRPVVAEENGETSVPSETEPEGIIRRRGEHRLEFEISFVAEAIGKSVRCSGQLAFDQALAWRHVRAEASVRPYSLEIKGDSASREIWFRLAEGDTEWIRSFQLDDLRRPETLLQGPGSEALLSLLPSALAATSAANLELGLEWQARSEWLRIGRSKVRVYRLEARLFDRHQIVLLVSRVGELLRVELPADLRLVNDILFVN